MKKNDKQIMGDSIDSLIEENERLRKRIEILEAEKEEQLNNELEEKIKPILEKLLREYHPKEERVWWPEYPAWWGIYPPYYVQCRDYTTKIAPNTSTPDEYPTHYNYPDDYPTHYYNPYDSTVFCAKEIKK